MATVHPESQGHEHGDGHGHSPYLHHHFETPVQQFESDKLGMWLFLATEILLFGGLFCAYSVYRHNHPEVFHYAHQYLDKIMGGTNTVVLIFSSFTMAWAVRAIQQGQRLLCAGLLVITLLCAATFMVIKYFEYSAKIEHGLLWGQKYQPHHEEDGHGEVQQTTGGGHGSESAAGATGAATEESHEIEGAQPGATLEEAPAHERAANEKIEGEPSLAGVDRQPAIAGSTEQKVGAMPVQDEPAIGVSHKAPDTPVSSEDVASATEAAEHREEIALTKTPEVTVEGAATPGGTAAGVQPLESGSTQVAGTASPPGVLTTSVPSGFKYPSGVKLEPTKIKPAALPPAGLKEETVKAAPDHGPEPRNVQTFFAIYFAMTGLHGIHVLIGMIVIGIMLVYVLRGKYNADYWTPVDLTGLYWHIVDLIWIFLFPLLYLIS